MAMNGWVPKPLKTILTLNQTTRPLPKLTVHMCLPRNGARARGIAKWDEFSGALQEDFWQETS